MRAEQFIKDHGLERAREVVEGAPVGATHYGLRQYRQWKGRILKTFTDESWMETAVFGGNLRFIEDDCLCIHDLKRLVESVDLITKVGGIENAKTFDEECIYCIEHWTDLERLTGAIQDYESIYGEGNE